MTQLSTLTLVVLLIAPSVTLGQSAITWPPNNSASRASIRIDGLTPVGGDLSNRPAAAQLRQRDSLKNGLLIGAAVGAGAGFAIGALSYGCVLERECYGTWVTMALGAGVGAGIGAGLDAFLGRQVRDRPGEQQPTVFPIIGKRVYGAATRLTF